MLLFAVGRVQMQYEWDHDGNTSDGGDSVIDSEVNLFWMNWAFLYQAFILDLAKAKLVCLYIVFILATTSLQSGLTLLLKMH